MNKLIAKTILTVTVVAIVAAGFTGCKKKEYTINTPYDFSQIQSGKTDETETTAGDESNLTPTIGGETEPNTTNESDPNNNAASSGGSATQPPASNPNGNSASSQDPSSGDNSSTGDSGTSSGSGNSSGSVGNSGTQGTPSGSANDSSSKGTEIEDISFIEVAADYQIPKDIEDKMTTKALLDTYMSYPFLDLICFEESPEDSYDQWIHSDASCGTELMSRKDIVSVVLNYYKELLAMEPTTHITGRNEIDLELKLDWVELLLNQNTVKSKASDAEKADILKQAQLRDANVEKNGYAITDLLPDLAAAYK